MLNQNDAVHCLSMKYNLAFLSINIEPYWKETRLLDVSATILSKGKTEEEWVDFFTEFSSNYCILSDEDFVQICCFSSVDSLLVSNSEVFAVLSIPITELTMPGTENGAEDG